MEWRFGRAPLMALWSENQRAKSHSLSALPYGE